MQPQYFCDVQERNKQQEFEHSREVTTLEGIIRESKQAKILDNKMQETFIENARNKMNILKVLSRKLKSTQCGK